MRLNCSLGKGCSNAEPGGGSEERSGSERSLRGRGRFTALIDGQSIAHVCSQGGPDSGGQMGGRGSVGLGSTYRISYEGRGNKKLHQVAPPQPQDRVSCSPVDLRFDVQPRMYILKFCASCLQFPGIRITSVSNHVLCSSL